MLSQVVQPMIVAKLEQLASDERAYVEAQILLQNEAARTEPERGLAKRKMNICPWFHSHKA